MTRSPSLVALPYAAADVYCTCLETLPNLVWLDSNSGLGSRFDIISADPIAILYNPSASDMIDSLAELTDECVAPAEFTLPFAGGLIGYHNYEARHSDTGLQAPTRNDLKPSRWGLFDWALVLDHRHRSAHAVFLAHCSTARRTHILAQLRQAPNRAIKAAPFTAGPFLASISYSEYRRAFEKIQDYILAGDCYQVNYAQQFSASFSGSALSAYRSLRSKTASPYSAYLDLGAEKVLSFSPEQFIRLQERTAQSRPIKGTAPRSTLPDNDRRNADALTQSIKNKAENLMIVDLLRNDFSRYCSPYSVKVPKLFELESFTNVHHLVSTITGELKPDCKPINFFNGCFPGGSITGAPKKRAMEIIEELEPCARNIYCGSIAYISINGNIDSNIAIRSMLVHDGRIDCWGGGGIVADSTVDEEYRESIQKVAVLMENLSGTTIEPAP